MVANFTYLLALHEKMAEKLQASTKYLLKYGRKENLTTCIVFAKQNATEKSTKRKAIVESLRITEV